MKETVCPKCGYKESADDNLVVKSGGCPKCGVIYSKARAPRTSQRPVRQKESADVGQQKKLMPFFVLLGAVLLLAGAVSYLAYLNNKEASSEASTIESAASEQIERQPETSPSEQNSKEDKGSSRIEIVDDFSKLRSIIDDNADLKDETEFLIRGIVDDTAAEYKTNDGNELVLYGFSVAHIRSLDDQSMVSLWFNTQAIEKPVKNSIVEISGVVKRTGVVDNIKPDDYRFSNQNGVPQKKLFIKLAYITQFYVVDKIR